MEEKTSVISKTARSVKSKTKKPKTQPHSKVVSKSVKTDTVKGNSRKKTMAHLQAELVQREAELQIINSIQQGLASKLDFQSIIDLVGEQVRVITKAYSVFIALYDKTTELVTWPYWVNDDERIESSPEPLKKNITRLILYASEPLNLGTEEEILAHDAIPPEGYTVGKSFLGVPFTIGDALLGALSLHDLEQEHAFSDSDARLLQTLANSMGVALESARLFDETQRLFRAEQERVAELQIINSIQQGLAAELDFQAIVDLVGDKLRDVFNTPNLNITWYDEKAHLIHYLYIYEYGKRKSVDPQPPRAGGIFETLVRTRQPIVMNTVEDLENLNATIPLPGTKASKSSIEVPIISSDRVLGGIGIDNFEHENAFGESEIRLVTTVAASLGTALENARLFDETQRLLKETEQRAAELAIINSVQEGLASNLEIQAIYKLLGDKIREVFDAQVVTIVTFDQERQLSILNYGIEKGKQFFNAPYPFTAGHHHLIRTRLPVFINQDWEQRMRQLGFSMSIAPGTQTPKSSIIVPLVVEQTVKGSVSLQNVDRENAFSESDVRLLQTLANSMSVALENARLFDETQRLLKETEQRNAELAIINSVQAALAAELNIQGIYEAVGDKIREIFHNTDMNIRIYDPKTDLIHYPYVYENGERITIDSTPSLERGISWHVLHMRETVVINENMEEEVAKYGSFILPGTQADKSAVYVP